MDPSPKKELINYAYGETDVGQVQFYSTNEGSVEQIVQIAKELWKKIKGLQNTDEENQRLNKELIKERKFKDFQTSFPIVYRWMLDGRQFNEKAFNKFLRRHGKKMWNNRKEFVEAQADYLVLLYQESHPRYDTKRVREYRSSMIEHLLEEDRKFDEMKEETKKEVEIADEKAGKIRRKQLYEFLTGLKSEQETIQPTDQG